MEPKILQFAHLSPTHYIATTREFAGLPGEPELRRAELRDHATDSSVAGVEYEHDKEHGSNYITWMGSNEKNKGHTQSLLHHIYNMDNDFHVNFGSVISKPAEHIMNKFADKYPDRTSGEVNLDEDYAREMAEVSRVENNNG